MSRIASIKPLVRRRSPFWRAAQVFEVTPSRSAPRVKIWMAIATRIGLQSRLWSKDQHRAGIVFKLQYLLRRCADDSRSDMCRIITMFQ
jgi:hypothetical protein